jgi:hypothetical protein
MIAVHRRSIEVREATPDDLPVIAAMREANERDFIGKVDIPMDAVWWVADCDGQIVACAAVAVIPERKAIITDLYCEPTITGRKGLACLIRDGMGARAILYVGVPFDRPDLRLALERRGFVFTAWQGEYRP